MQKQIDICSTCRFGVRNYTSVIGNIPWCCEKHWHCKPGSLASDYVPKPEPKFDGVKYRRHTCPLRLSKLLPSLWRAFEKGELTDESQDR